MPPQYEVNRESANFLPDKFDPSKGISALSTSLYHGARPVVPDCEPSWVDPAVLASGVTLTTANTLLDLYVGRIVPNSV